MLIANPRGHYHFLKGIDPYSAGVIADPGYEIVHVTLCQLVPWLQGFEMIDAYLQKVDCDRHALCGVELRSPAPFALQGFIEFNRTYCDTLRKWDLYCGDFNPVARTNVAPFFQPPGTPALHGFSYIAPIAEYADSTLIIAGAGELRDGGLREANIICCGDTSAAAMREKASYVMKVMEERLHGLGGRWDLINTVDVYTVHSLDGLAEDIVLTRLGPARRHGICWYHARPPVVDIEFEMDMRGVRREICL